MGHFERKKLSIHTHEITQRKDVRLIENHINKTYESLNSYELIEIREKILGERKIKEEYLEFHASCILFEIEIE